ncbi:TPA: hypothetical protein ACM7C3_003894, partial [Escherichia coli]
LFDSHFIAHVYCRNRSFFPKIISVLHGVFRARSKKRFKGRSMRCGYLKRAYDSWAAWGCNGKALTEARA